MRRSAGRASRQYAINESSEEVAITAAIESAEWPSKNAPRPARSRPQTGSDLNAAGCGPPTALVISGSGCIVAFMMLGMVMPKASATAIKSAAIRAGCAQPATVIASSVTAAAAESVEANR